MSKSNPPSTPPVDSITLDTIVEYLRKGILEAQLQPYPKSTKVLDHYEKHTKELLNVWHTKATTKELLALLPEKKTSHLKKCYTDQFKCLCGHDGFNTAIDQIIANIQAREEQ